MMVNRSRLLFQYNVIPVTLIAQGLCLDLTMKASDKKIKIKKKKPLVELRVPKGEIL